MGERVLSPGSGRYEGFGDSHCDQAFNDQRQLRAAQLSPWQKHGLPPIRATRKYKPTSTSSTSTPSRAFPRLSGLSMVAVLFGLPLKPPKMGYLQKMRHPFTQP